MGMLLEEVKVRPTIPSPSVYHFCTRWVSWFFSMGRFGSLSFSCRFKELWFLIYSCMKNGEFSSYGWIGGSGIGSQGGRSFSDAVTFHTDSRDAVPQLQKGEEASFWRLRPLLSQFMCLQNSCDFKVIKISRHENRFAMQAKAVNNHNSAIFSCNSQEHQSSCAAITVGDRRSSNVTTPPASSPWWKQQLTRILVDKHRDAVLFFATTQQRFSDCTSWI